LAVETLYKQYTLSAILSVLSYFDLAL